MCRMAMRRPHGGYRVYGHAKSLLKDAPMAARDQEYELGSVISLPLALLQRGNTPGGTLSAAACQ